MKLNQIRTKTINAASALALDTAIETFVQAAGEATYLDMRYCESSGNYSVLIIYTL